MGVEVEFCHKRVTKTKRHFDELCEDQCLFDGEKRFKVNVFLACLDIAISQLNHRFVGLNQIVDSFAMIQPQVLLKLTEEELAKECDNFRERYYDDVTDQLLNQLLSLRSCLKDQISKIKSIREFADLLLIKYFTLSASFPDVCSTIIFFLTIPVNVATAERSFSKLKLIKTYLRN